MPAALIVVQRAEQDVVVQPPALAFLERPQRAGAAVAGPPQIVGEPGEGTPQRAALEGAHRRIVDARRRTRKDERRVIVGQEGVRSRSHPLGDFVERDEQRIERHRAQGGVRRALPLLHFVERQELDEVTARVVEPPGKRDEIGNLTDPPTPARRHRKERNQHTRVPSGIESRGAALSHRSAPARVARLRQTPPARRGG
jgi:hypothetical protein